MEELLDGRDGLPAGGTAEVAHAECRIIVGNWDVDSARELLLVVPGGVQRGRVLCSASVAVCARRRCVCWARRCFFDV